MKNYQQQNELEEKGAGFSLVETLVAISILLTVTSGIMLLVNQSIESEEMLSNRLAASYLASDAIEYLRYRRDTYWLDASGNTFDEFVTNSLPDCQSNPCKVDTRVGKDHIDPCYSTPCEKLRYSPGTKQYGHGSGVGQESQFTRLLHITERNDTGSESPGYDEIVVEVTVEWTNQAGNTSDLTLTDTLTAWAD